MQTGVRWLVKDLRGGSQTWLNGLKVPNGSCSMAIRDKLAEVSVAVKGVNNLLQ